MRIMLISTFHLNTLLSVRAETSLRTSKTSPNLRIFSKSLQEKKKPGTERKELGTQPRNYVNRLWSADHG
jgi:hypothetical protein